MVKILSSRLDDASIGVQAFDKEELELIAALMYNVRWGAGIKYKQAAFRILEKLDNLHDDDFCQNASLCVDPHIIILDSQGYPLMTIGPDKFEIDV